MAVGKMLSAPVLYVVRRHPAVLSGLIACALFAGVFVVVEVFCYFRTRDANTLRAHESVFRTAMMEKPSPYGYTLRPNSMSPDKFLYKGTVEYDVVYRTDEVGRRTTARAPGATGTRFAVWFTDSFAFGMGNNEDQTLPYYLSKCRPEFTPYNYGCPGYGPQQTLLRLQGDTLRKEIAEEEGVAIYVFIHRHFNRLIGSMQTGNCAITFPCYELANGDVVYRGSFQEAHPWRTFLYRWMQRCHTLQYFNADFPPAIDADHVELMAQALKKAREEFKRQFPKSEFYVLFYPFRDEPLIPQLCGRLDSLGVPYFDYRRLLDSAGPSAFYNDGHPIPASQEAVAKRLAEDLP